MFQRLFFEVLKQVQDDKVGVQGIIKNYKILHFFNFCLIQNKRYVNLILERVILALGFRSL